MTSGSEIGERVHQRRVELDLSIRELGKKKQIFPPPLSARLKEEK